MRAFAQNPFMRNAMLANVKYIYALSMWSVEKRVAGWYFSKSAYQAYLARTLFERDQRDVDDRAGYLCAGRAVRASEDTNIYMRQMEALMPRIGRRIALIGFVAIALLQPALAEPPKFQVDPTWPQALPNNWIIGTIGGIFVDAQDHIWINQRPSSLDAREKRASTATNVICCVPAPPVIEFDQAGKGAGLGMAPITSGATMGTASSSTTTISSGSATTSRLAGTSTNSPATVCLSCGWASPAHPAGRMTPNTSTAPLTW
jgi:hypothetical protein